MPTRKGGGAGGAAGAGAAAAGGRGDDDDDDDDGDDEEVEEVLPAIEQTGEDARTIVDTILAKGLMTFPNVEAAKKDAKKQKEGGLRPGGYEPARGAAWLAVPVRREAEHTDRHRGPDPQGADVAPRGGEGQG